MATREYYLVGYAPVLIGASFSSFSLNMPGNLFVECSYEFGSYSFTRARSALGPHAT